MSIRYISTNKSSRCISSRHYVQTMFRSLSLQLSAKKLPSVRVTHTSVSKLEQQLESFTRDINIEKRCERKLVTGPEHFCVSPFEEVLNGNREAGDFFNNPSKGWRNRYSKKSCDNPYIVRFFARTGLFLIL